jgi:hypothetical protein
VSYKEWKIWLYSLPWSLRWFPILVLIRPVIDQFWNLKQFSPLLSPLYWVGVLTPVFCLIGIMKYQSQTQTLPVKFFKIWAILAIINIVIVFILNLDFGYLILFLKVSLPVYLFYFLRVFIVSKIDLVGILTAFIYSWGIVILLFIYELIFGARSIELTRQNLVRWEGGFADVLNYALYAVSGFIAMCYFYFGKKKGNVFQRLIPSLVSLLFGVLILSRIYHTTSFIAMSALIALALFRIFKEKPSIGFIFIIIVGIAYITYGEKLIKNAFDPLVAKEISVYEQGTDSYRQFNGRMGRWIDRWGMFNNGNLVGKIFGAGIGFFGNESLFGSSVHNDFFRITFSSGFLGIFFYLLFYLGLLTRRKYFDEGEKFLLEACILMLIFYSATTVPTMYAPFMYFLLSVFAYSSLPEENLYVDQEIID